MKKALVTAAQIAALGGLNWIGHAGAEFLTLPLPGNLLGMMLLLTLLGCGVVRLSWIESGASLLLAHLAFFFIPIAVGLISFADVLQRDGLAWLVTLVIAAAVGIFASGITVQSLATRARVRAS